MKHRAYVDAVDSPAGPIRFAVAEDGRLLLARFEAGGQGRPLETDLEREGFAVAAAGERTREVREQVQEYARGTRRAFELPLALRGSEWQLRVWTLLSGIPFGETSTYLELARLAGRPGAARAVGRANATNRLPLFVPCHRVLGSSGALTGFADGVHLKRRLLEHERRTGWRPTTD